MATYTVFESVNMGSTHFAERMFDAVCDTDVENGTFGYLEEIDGEVYKFHPGTKKGEIVVVVDQPVYDEYATSIANQRKDKFIVEKGMTFRVRTVGKNDTFGITIEGVTSATQTKMKKGAFLPITILSFLLS